MTTGAKGMDYFNPLERLVIDCFDLVDDKLVHRHRPRDYFETVDDCEAFNKDHEGKAVASGDVVGLCGCVFRRSSLVRILERYQGKEKARSVERAVQVDSDDDWLD